MLWGRIDLKDLMKKPGQSEASKAQPSNSGYKDLEIQCSKAADRSMRRGKDEATES